MAEQGYLLSENALERVRRSVRWSETQNGPGVTNSPYGASSANPAGNKPSPGHSPIRWFKVTASASTGVNDANGNPVQWTYTVTEVYKQSTGYGGWGVKSGTYVGTAYNSAEEGNDGTGVQMNGVDHDGADYPSTVSMQPLQNNAILPGVMIYTADGTPEVWLMPFGLGEDGSCS